MDLKCLWDDSSFLNFKLWISFDLVNKNTWFFKRRVLGRIFLSNFILGITVWKMGIILLEIFLKKILTTPIPPTELKSLAAALSTLACLAEALGPLACLAAGARPPILT